MAGNCIGSLFRVTTFGESHGAMIGVVIDGVPAGLALDGSFIQKELDRRRVGQSSITSQRKEPDLVEIVSGLFEGMSTGAPVAMIIKNADHKSSAYDEIKDQFRPGHADYSWQMKYGIRDHRGGGRSSARETACRVAAGAVAKLFLAESGIDVFAHTLQIGTVIAEIFDRDVIETNMVRCADKNAAGEMIELIEQVRKNNDSVGGAVEIIATSVPAGLGEPVYDRLDADIAKGLMSINAVKGVEIGAGFSACYSRGSDNNDHMRTDENGAVGHLSNNAGGIEGGVSNGNEIVARIALKPTPSILKSQKSLDKELNEIDITVKGRHDPCVVPRAVPVAEAMVAITLADHLLRQRAARV